MKTPKQGAHALGTRTHCSPHAKPTGPLRFISSIWFSVRKVETVRRYSRHFPNNPKGSNTHFLRCREVSTMVDVQINTLLKDVLPELALQGIRLLDYEDLDHAQKSKVHILSPSSRKTASVSFERQRHFVWLLDYGRIGPRPKAPSASCKLKVFYVGHLRLSLGFILFDSCRVPQAVLFRLLVTGVEGCSFNRL